MFVADNGLTADNGVVGLKGAEMSFIAIIYMYIKLIIETGLLNYHTRM